MKQRLLRDLGIAAALAGVAAVMVLQYWMPRGWTTQVGFVDHGAVIHFSHAVWGRLLPPLGERAYATAMQLSFILAWSGYVLAVLTAWRCGAPGAIGVFVAAMVTAVALALLTPPSLTPDAYLYAAYPRLQLLHGVNPYVHSEASLTALGEAHARFLGPSGYGPVWTLLSLFLEAPLRHATLWQQVVALRLLEAAALAGCALAARAVANAFEPGRGDLTLMVVAANPLFLLEGPGSGHNDLVMLCLLLAGVALCLRGRYSYGIFSIGLSAGVKFITGAFVPWMYLARLPPQPGRRVLLLALTGLLAAAPIALAYLPFWHGLATLGGLAQNSEHNAPSPLPILLLFLALLPWVWRHAGEGKWVTAWVIVTLFLFFTSQMRHPWYLSWPLMLSLTRWDFPQRVTTGVCCFVAALLTFFYGVGV